MTDSPNHRPNRRFRWKHCRDCGDRFEAYTAMFYCPKCREERHPTTHSSKTKEKWWRGYKDRPLADVEREEFDWQLLDEHGAEVWASDLAERYKSELRRRRQGDYRNQHSRSSDH